MKEAAYTYHNGTQILRLKTIKKKFNVLSKYFVHPFGN